MSHFTKKYVVLIHAMAASVLLIAAVLKLAEMVLHPHTYTNYLFESRVLHLFAIEVEILLAFILFSGFLPLVAWRLTSALLFTFCCTNLAQGLQGNRTCSCLGILAISPWIMLIIDLLLLIFLLRAGPRQASLEVSSNHCSSNWRTALQSGSIIVLALGSSLWLYARPSRETATQVSFEPAFHDFGRASEGLTLTTSCRLINHSLSEIVITDVETSCNCTQTGEAKGKTVAPGETIEIPVSLRTGNQQEVRRESVTVLFKSSKDVVPARRAMHITADVRTDYDVMPNMYQLEPMHFGDSKRVEVQVIPKEKKDIQITALKVEPPHYQANVVGRDEQSGAWKIELAGSAQKHWTTGPKPAVLTITTNSESAPSKQVMLMCSYVAPYELDRSVIVISADQVGMIQANFKVKTDKPRKLVLLRKSLWITDVSIKQQEALQWEVQLSLPEPHGSAGFTGELVLELQPKGADGTSKAIPLTIPLHRLITRK